MTEIKMRKKVNSDDMRETKVVLCRDIVRVMEQASMYLRRMEQKAPYFISVNNDILDDFTEVSMTAIQDKWSNDYLQRPFCISMSYDIGGVKIFFVVRMDVIADDFDFTVAYGLSLFDNVSEEDEQNDEYADRIDSFQSLADDLLSGPIFRYVNPAFESKDCGENHLFCSLGFGKNVLTAVSTDEELVPCADNDSRLDIALSAMRIQAFLTALIHGME